MPDLENGVYFRLPEDEYHALERFSASHACNMLVSPGTFWAESWMNPDREPDEETEAKIVGSAYHVARFEPERLDELYVSQPDPEDYPDALMTGTAIEAELAALGLPKTKAGEKVLDKAMRLKEAGYGGHIWPLVMDEWEETRGDRQAIKPKVWREIKRDMERLRGNAEMLPFLTDGQAEVSILWTDKAGVKWKARIDWLKVRHIVDLKTFDNSRRANLDACIADAIRFNRYYVKAAVYWRAAELVRTGDLPIKKIQNQAQKDLIEAIRASEDPFEFWWIFQEKKGVPNVLARQFRMTSIANPHYLAQAPDEARRKSLAELLKSPSMLWRKAQAEADHARNLFIQGMEIWGTKQPWGPMVPVSDVDDEAFAPYWLEQ